MLRLLAIVGSARFTSPDAEPRARRIIRSTLLEMLPDVVISGGADVVDTWAEEEAVELGWFEHAGTLRIHRPKRRQWAGAGGFKERNLMIAQEATHALRISCTNAKTYGSGWTADRAEELGAQVWRHVLS
jgi:hypothetical protein